MGKLENISKTLENVSKSLASLLKIAILSKATGKYDISPKQSELVILGNGPSLRDLLDNHRDFLSNKDLLVVNFSSTSADYTSLKPAYYLLMDPAFFNDRKTTEKVFTPMVNDTTWPMILFVPSTARKFSLWQEMVAKNSNITVKYFNSTPVEGFTSFCHFCYNRRWGMPRPRNVLVACCMVALQLPYRKIYLAGADHSWMKEIWVDDNNVVQEDRAHFYDKKGTTRVTSPYKLYMLVESMAIAFRSYLYVEEYSKTINKKIYNISEGSYIDAFERFHVR